MHDTLSRIGSTPPDRDEIESVKRTLLLRWAQGYETNAATADFYAENLTELEQQADSGITRQTSNR